MIQTLWYLNSQYQPTQARFRYDPTEDELEIASTLYDTPLVDINDREQLGEDIFESREALVAHISQRLTESGDEPDTMTLGNGRKIVWEPSDEEDEDE